MQKKLIAVAVAGLLSAPAFAQSNVTISGLVKMGWEQYKLSDTGAASYSKEQRISDQSSRLIFSGTEDLGGGMKAVFQIDNRFGPDMGGFAANGNTHVGLTGNWGGVRLGRQDLHYGAGLIESDRAGSLQGYLAPGPFAQVNGQTIANGTRTPNVIMYDSPNWNGFSGKLAYSSAWAATEGSGLNDGSAHGAWNLALNYVNGPWVAGYSYWSAKAEGTGAGVTVASRDERGDTLQFGYTFPMGIKVGLGWNKSRYTPIAIGGAAGSELSRSAWLLPVSYTFGPNAVYLTYMRAGNTTNVSDSGATAWKVGYDYALSKRTNVGAYYTRLTNKANGSYDLFGLSANGATATPAGADASQFYLGLAHAF